MTSRLGKSMFQHLLLRFRLNARLPTLLQFRSDRVYLFVEHGAYALEGGGLKTSAAEVLGKLVPNAWCLVDSNAYMAIPSEFLESTNLTIVQSASPRSERMQWLKKIRAPQFILCMKPFTLEEAIIARQFQLWQPNEEMPTGRELERWYQCYTPSARTAYTFASSPSAYEDTLREELVNINAASFAELAHQVQGRAAPQDDKKPHEIFIYYPQSDHVLAHSCISIPTNYLVSMVLHLLQVTNAERRMACYRMWSGIKAMATINGRLLEDMAMEFLPKGGSFLMKELEIKTAKVNQQWVVPAASTSPPWHLVIGDAASPPISIRANPAQDPYSPLPRPVLVKFDTADSSTSGFCIPVQDNQPTFDFVYIQ
ncbi:hypothetical protein BS17DRAFT_351887 [Gyrodon lividus]|nr:hypothetical protein BS17DRAFT_351887 [Gyrodon lividus]